MRAAALLVVIAGRGVSADGLAVAPAFPYRDLEIGPASLGRRDRLPVALSSGDDPSSRSGPDDHRGPISMKSGAGVSCAVYLVIKDEHGRLVATQEVDKRNEQTVIRFLQQTS